MSALCCSCTTVISIVFLKTIRLCAMNVFTALIKTLTLEEEKLPEAVVHSNISHPFSSLSEVGTVCLVGSIIEWSQPNLI